MKKQFLCLMIAGLSLFALPYSLTAGTVPVKAITEESAPPVVTPALEKKMENFKHKHPAMFSEKQNKAENNSSNSKQAHGGGVYYISGTALVLIIILLIILL
ncbi:hypothetical protein BH11BAC7_BH11BAC7_24720 [soil metagenome]